MPFFFAAFFGALIQMIGTIAGRVLVSVGIGFVAYQGFDAGMSWIKGQIILRVSSLGAQGIAVLGAMEVGTAVNVVLSAVMARLVLNGLTSGTMHRMVGRAPGATS